MAAVAAGTAAGATVEAAAGVVTTEAAAGTTVDMVTAAVPDSSKEVAGEHLGTVVGTLMCTFCRHRVPSTIGTASACARR